MGVSGVGGSSAGQSDASQGGGGCSDASQGGDGAGASQGGDGAGASQGGSDAAQGGQGASSSDAGSGAGATQSGAGATQSGAGVGSDAGGPAAGGAAGRGSRYDASLGADNVGGRQGSPQRMATLMQRLDQQLSQLSSLIGGGGGGFGSANAPGGLGMPGASNPSGSNPSGSNGFGSNPSGLNGNGSNSPAGSVGAPGAQVGRTGNVGDSVGGGTTTGTAETAKINADTYARALASGDLKKNGDGTWTAAMDAKTGDYKDGAIQGLTYKMLQGQNATAALNAGVNGKGGAPGSAAAEKGILANGVMAGINGGAADVEAARVGGFRTNQVYKDVAAMAHIESGSKAGTLDSSDTHVQSANGSGGLGAFQNTAPYTSTAGVFNHAVSALGMIGHGEAMAHVTSGQVSHMSAAQQNAQFSRVAGAWNTGDPNQQGQMDGMDGTPLPYVQAMAKAAAHNRNT